MPGGLKGPSQVGTQTTQTQNPLAQAQGNLLQGGWGGPGFERPGSAVDLAQNNPITAYPGQTYAGPTEQQYTGLNNLYNAGAFAQGPLFNQAKGVFDQGTGGQFGYAQSPSYNNLLPYAGGNAASIQGALGNAGDITGYANQSAAFGPSAYNAMMGLGTQASGTGNQYAGMLADTGNQYGTGLRDLSQQSINAGQGYAGNLQGAGARSADLGQQYGTGLNLVGQQAGGLGIGYGNQLAGAAGGALGSSQGYGNQLSGAAYGAGNSANQYANTLTGASLGAGNNANQYANTLTGASFGAGDSANRYADTLTGASFGAGDAANQYANMLAGTGYQAGGAGAQAGRQLSRLAGQIPGMTAPAQSLLGYNALTATSNNPANAYLQQEASGANFGNPYLESLYGSAARGVTSQFQTGTSPRLASEAAKAGRYGSGILANQEQKAADQFGTNLTDLAAKLYTPAYAQDRSQQLAAAQSLGTQYGQNLSTGTQAAQALGNLGLGSADAIRNALTGASQQRLQGLQQQGANLGAAGQTSGTGYGQMLSGLRDAATTAGQGQGQVLSGLSNAATAAGQGQGQLLSGLSNAATAAGQGQGQVLSGLANAATAVGQGQGQYLTGLQSAADAANRGLATQAGALGTGGQLGLSGASQDITANTAAATAGLRGLEQGGSQLQAGGALSERALADANSAAQSGYQNAINAGQIGGNQMLTGLSNAGTLGYNAGQLGLGAGTQQLGALRDLQGMWNTGIGNQFTAANMAPSLANLLAGGAQRQLDVGTQYQTLEQAQLADQQKRFQEQQMAPRQNLQSYLQSIAGNYGTNTSSSQPIYGSPLAQAAGGLGSLNSILGSGGLNLGGISGVGSGIGSALGLGGGGSALAGIGSGALPAVLAPEIGAAGLGSLAAMNAGTAFAPALASAAAAAPLAATIVCTELVKQGKMPDTWRKAGMRQFMAYPEVARRGYWVWATPVVHHLRTKPDSRFSKVVERTFNWRAEDLAARNGVKGARRLLRGRLVTAAMVIPCLACGLITRRGYTYTTKDAPA